MGRKKAWSGLPAGYALVVRYHISENGELENSYTNAMLRRWQLLFQRGYERLLNPLDIQE
jgi:hypothetical protein